MHIRSCLVVVAAALLTACGSQPSSPVSPVSPSPASLAQVANYAGEWTVTAMQTACIPASRYTCQRPPLVATTHTLRLAQIGASVTGTFDGVDASGDVDAEGRLRLTGHRAIVDYGGTWDLTSFEATQTASGGLAGAWTDDWWIPENFEPLGGRHHAEYSVLEATRGALPASFTGRWTGNFQTQGCTGSRCAGPEKEFDLRLEESGGMVTGSLELRLNMRAHVAGFVSGSSAQLTSVTDDAVPSPFRLTSMQVQRTPTGRMTGTFTIEFPRGQIDALELVQVSLAADVDLPGVALTPGRP